MRPVDMKSMICTPENAAEFNAELRAEPALFAFTKALHAAGMVSGLRGARIAPVGSQDEARGVSVHPVLSLDVERKHADRAWKEGTWRESPDEAKVRELNRQWMQRGQRKAGVR